jgi:hypothetical protein
MAVSPMTKDLSAVGASASASREDAGLGTRRLRHVQIAPVDQGYLVTVVYSEGGPTRLAFNSYVEMCADLRPLLAKKRGAR